MTHISATACPLFDEYDANSNDKKFTCPGKAKFDGACCADGWLNQELV